MFYKELKLDDIIKRMKSLGNVLVPYNFPKMMPTMMEDDLSVLKQREAVVDGYQIVLNYQKSDYDEYFTEILQIYNKNSPFLPFNLICKLGKRFLGDGNLSLIEIFKDNRKIYIWTVYVDQDGNSIPIPHETESEECEFEGFNYLYMQPNQVNFY
jgi:hypothetical protein